MRAQINSHAFILMVVIGFLALISGISTYFLVLQSRLVFITEKERQQYQLKQTLNYGEKQTLKLLSKHSSPPEEQSLKEVQLNTTLTPSRDHYYSLSNPELNLKDYLHTPTACPHSSLVPYLSYLKAASLAWDNQTTLTPGTTFFPLIQECFIEFKKVGHKLTITPRLTLYNPYPKAFHGSLYQVTSSPLPRIHYSTPQKEIKGQFIKNYQKKSDNAFIDLETVSGSFSETLQPYEKRSIELTHQEYNLPPEAFRLTLNPTHPTLTISLTSNQQPLQSLTLPLQPNIEVTPNYPSLLSFTLNLNQLLTYKNQVNGFSKHMEYHKTTHTPLCSYSFGPPTSPKTYHNNIPALSIPTSIEHAPNLATLAYLPVTNGPVNRGINPLIDSNSANTLFSTLWDQCFYTQRPHRSEFGTYITKTLPITQPNTWKAFFQDSIHLEANLAQTLANTLVRNLENQNITTVSEFIGHKVLQQTFKEHLIELEDIELIAHSDYALCNETHTWNAQFTARNDHPYAPKRERKAILQKRGDGQFIAHSIH